MFNQIVFFQLFQDYWVLFSLGGREDLGEKCQNEGVNVWFFPTLLFLTQEFRIRGSSCLSFNKVSNINFAIPIREYLLTDFWKTPYTYLE